MRRSRCPRRSGGRPRGFHDFATAFVRLRAASCGVNEALGGSCPISLEVVDELRESIRRLVERAQAAGAIRADVAWQDVPFLLAAVATGDRTVGLRAGERQWERNLRVVLDGLRTGGGEPLPGTPPAEPPN